MAAEDEQLEGEAGPDIFYVSEKGLADVQAKLKDGKDFSEEDVNVLAFPENLADDAVMVPVDMHGVGEEFDDVEAMVEKLGPKGTAEAFIKARAYFEKNNDPKDEDSPKPMTAAEWKAILAEEDSFLEGEEEEFLGEEGEEEFGEEAEEEVEEPAAKKAKTDE